MTANEVIAALQELIAHDPTVGDWNVKAAVFWQDGDDDGWMTAVSRDVRRHSGHDRTGPWIEIEAK
jgi:hypothetical protein